MPKTEHLEYYLKNKISPVEQDLADLKKHLERRESLYRFLGVPSIFLEDKRVLEVGPGTGQNSIHLASSLPKELVLVEPNPIGREQIKQNYKSWNLPRTEPTLEESEFLDFKREDELFDLALAECWLGRTDSGILMLKKLLENVKVGGIVIVTASPNIGLLPTTLRAALGYRMISDPDLSFQDKTDLLMKSFSSHLDTLTNMSRFQPDWIQDNLLNPAALTEIIHPIELFEVFNNAHILGSYPQIMESWEWYKSLHGKNLNMETSWVEQYWNKSHNFLDVNSVTESEDSGTNYQLEGLCKDLTDRVVKLREHNNPDKELLSLSSEIKKFIPESKQELIKSIVEWETIYQKDKVTSHEVNKMDSFSRWFGRETIYMSFIRMK